MIMTIPDSKSFDENHDLIHGILPFYVSIVLLTEFRQYSSTIVLNVFWSKVSFARAFIWV
jgi:hypothetical protein